MGGTRFAFNQEISHRQLRRLLMIATFAGSAVLLPVIATAKAGRNAVIAVLLATIGTVVYGWILSAMADKMHGGYLATMQRVLPRPLFWLILFLYVIRYVIRGAFILTIFQSMLGATLLTRQNDYWLAIPILLVCIYATYRTMQGRARLLELVFWWLFVPVVIIALLGILNVDMHYVLPETVIQGGNSLRAILRADYAVMIFYIPLEFVLFSLPMVAKKCNRIRIAMQEVVIVGILNIILYVIVVGLLGTNWTSEHSLAVLKAMQMVKLPGGLLERLDLFAFGFLLIGFLR